MKRICILAIPLAILPIVAMAQIVVYPSSDSGTYSAGSCLLEGDEKQLYSQGRAMCLKRVVTDACTYAQGGDTVVLGASGGTLYGANGIEFITATGTGTSTALQTATATWTGTGTGSSTTSQTVTQTGTVTGTGTAVVSQNFPLTGTWTIPNTITLTGTVTTTISGTVTITATATGTNTVAGLTGTVTGSATATNTATGTGTSTATSTTTATGNGTLSVTSTGSHTITYTVTDTDTKTITGSNTATVTITGTASASGTATGTLTGTVTVTTTATSTTATLPTTITFDSSQLEVPGGDVFLATGAWNAGNNMAFVSTPTGGTSDPTATPTPGSPSAFAVSCDNYLGNTLCSIVNHPSVASSAKWVSAGGVHIWLWAKSTSAAQIKLFFDTCTGGSPTGGIVSIPTVTLDVTSTDWQLLSSSFSLSTGFLLPANYQFCVTFWAYASSGTPTVTLGATSPHYTRLNGPWIQSGANTLR